MSIGRRVYDLRKSAWISERPRFLNPSPPSPVLPDDPLTLTVEFALDRIAEDAKYVEDLMDVHQDDLEEVLTEEEWQVLQARVSRFWDTFNAYTQESVESAKAEALGRLIIDSTTIAEIDGFINGLIYCSVRELNLSETGAEKSDVELSDAGSAADKPAAGAAQAQSA